MEVGSYNDFTRRGPRRGWLGGGEAPSGIEEQSSGGGQRRAESICPGGGGVGRVG
jgi:hypothetical protein